MRGKLRVLGVLKKIAGEKAAGPRPLFTQLDLARAIEIIGTEHIGRNKLSERLGLGEGTTRTLIDRLMDARLIEISRSGCELTRSGQSILNEMNVRFGTRSKVSHSSVTVGAHNFGILVKGAANRIKSGIEQRDAAVRAGADGAVTFVAKHGELVMPPPAESMMRGQENAAKKIQEIFQPQENDAVIIAGADTERSAEEGARAAAWTLIE
jgi:DNA-binding transcriptional regulator LsrR (DeoR family)